MIVKGEGMFCRHQQWTAVRIRRNAFAFGIGLPGRRGVVPYEAPFITMRRAGTCAPPCPCSDERRPTGGRPTMGAIGFAEEWRTSGMVLPGRRGVVPYGVWLDCADSPEIGCIILSMLRGAMWASRPTRMVRELTAVPFPPV